MARAGYTVSPATCAICKKDGPSRRGARRHGWVHRGPEQSRRWYCPEHVPNDVCAKPTVNAQSTSKP